MLSIIIPALNEARRLTALLPALLRVCPEAEVIVADGGSSDDTRAVVARQPAARFVESRRGRARQMNAGAAVARGDVLLFLHADTWLPAETTLVISAALRDPAVAYGRFDVCFDNLHWPFRLIARLMNARSRLSGICTGDQAIFVRRQPFETLGGYPDIPLMEDVELTRRLKRMGRLAALRTPVTAAARKWEREGILRTILLMWTLRLLYFVGVSPERLHAWYYPALRPRSRG